MSEALTKNGKRYTRKQTQTRDTSDGRGIHGLVDKKAAEAKGQVGRAKYEERIGEQRERKERKEARKEELLERKRKRRRERETEKERVSVRRDGERRKER